MQWTRTVMTATLAGFACTAPPPATSGTSPRSDAPGAPAAPEAPKSPETPPPPVAPPQPATPETPPPPAAPATPEPDKPATAAAGALTMPFSVYAADIDHKSKAWRVDIVNFEGIDKGPLDKRLAELAEKEEEEFVASFAPGDPALPVGFSHGDPWTLITREGIEKRTAKGFDATVSGGSGTLHFNVDLGPSRPGAKDWALALRGHAATSARLVVPAPIAPAALAPGTLSRVVEALEPKLDDELRVLARKAKYAEKHVKLYPGRFPGGRSHVVFVAAETKLEDDETVEISGVLFARPGGAVEHFAVASVWGRATFYALVDIDGDGLDEVLWEDQYHEGWYLELIYWKDGKPEQRTLMGDGV